MKEPAKRVFALVAILNSASETEELVLKRGGHRGGALQSGLPPPPKGGPPAKLYNNSLLVFTFTPTSGKERKTDESKTKKR